jgi:metal-responsive CopG/Arc/MetJ family transcriptional regulator
MRIKTSVTLSQDVLKAVDKLSRSYKSRSEFVEVALRAFIAQTMRSQQNARDLEIINHRADALNSEAEDVLAYQAPL